VGLAQWLVCVGLALGTGAALRRWLPTNMLVYTLDRAFISTAAAAFIYDVLMQPLRRLVGAAAIAQAPAGRWVMA